MSDGIEPLYNLSEWKDFQLSMPYDELHLYAGNPVNCQFSVQV